MSVFLKACRREPTPYTPIWIMRQAGRYQPEYRALRERVSFIELCKTPELACEVTVRAVDQLGVDAGIIFADILLILEPLQIGFEFTDDRGPRIMNPIRNAAQVDRIPERIDAAESLRYVMDAIRTTEKELTVPLIGFAGAPFTLASYAIEGGGSKDYYETKKIMYGDEGLWNAFMTKLSAAIADYLRAQIDAGAQAVQLFDSWIGCLSAADYRRYVLPHTRAIFDALPEDTPAIHFGTGNPALYPAMREAGGDVIGIDWRISIDEVWSVLGDGVGLQGNMDPAALLTSPEVLRARASEVLQSAAGRPGHIFNLGHGIMPQATVDQARTLVDHVHEASQR
ncbi:MAG TPA: uroporphyrinogen decarboxylase [Polyangiales bacterium]|nr:uroporphyrinogen decarboxylase [Polyangiales bacterium]